MKQADKEIIAVLNQIKSSVVVGSTFDGAFTSLSGKPTTIAGYGITDAEPIGVSIVALEDIPAFTVATIKGNRANSANISYVNQVLGVTTAAINAGFSGNVITDGFVTSSVWSWSPGASIFLNGTNLSQSPASSGFSQVIAVAKTSDTIFVSLSDPFLF